ncbi:MAG TPA: amidohydrolase family protein [Acidimicrobiales bacterium]|nr:amidohydrolase family protein [Acidimicrobiales bacterium]
MGDALHLAASQVVTPDGVLRDTIVEIDGDAIAALRPARGAVPERTLVPGFVDLQVNGIGAIDVATADGGDWDELDQLLLAQGVTAWCPTLVTAPLERYGPALDRIAAATRRPVRGGPFIAGAHLEGPFLGGAPGAHRRELLRAIDLAWLGALPPIVRIVTLAPELAGACDAVAALSRRGIVVSLGHSIADVEQTRAAVDAGARMATHVFNGMGPFHHREPGIAGVVLTDDRVVSGVIADLVHLHPVALALVFRAKARRVALVTDAVAWPDPAAGVASLPDGTLAGATTTMDQAVRHLVHRAGVPLADAVHAAATAPADLLGLRERGRIAPGARADLVALDAGLGVEQVWVGGHAVGA